MPCSGPTSEEVRRADKQAYLYQLIIDLDAMPCMPPYEEWDKRAWGFTSVSWLIKLEKGLLESRQAINTHRLFDDATAYLCDIVKNFTPRQENHYLYNGHVSASRRLGEWWESHKEIDAKRITQEKKDKAKEVAQQEYDRVYKQMMGENSD